MSSGVRSILTARPGPAAGPETLPLDLPRVVSAFAVLALVFALFVPPTAFAGTRNWSLSRTPSSVAAGPASVQLTATNTGDDGGGEAVGCVVITIPNNAFPVTSASIDLVSDGDAWTASYAVGPTSTLVYLKSNSGGGNRLHGVPSEYVVATVGFTDTGLNGTFSWIGNAYNKEDCTDNFNQPKSLSVTISGAAPNTAPIGVPDSYSIAKNQALTDSAPGILSNDTDLDGDPLTATPVGVQPTANGSVTILADGSFTYTPNPGFAGSDSFVYQAFDGSLGSADTLVMIDVVDASPIGVPDPAYVATKGTPLTVDALAGVLANDTDPDGDLLTATPTGARPTTALGSVNVASDGSFVYTPAAGFAGVDSFTYQAFDGNSASLDTLVTITVANTAPVALPDGPYAAVEDTSLSVPFGTGVLANDGDLNGDPLTAVLVTNASKGVVTLNANGSFTYVPNPDAFGADSFTYQASDGSATSAVTTASISISAVSDPPSASADAYSTPEDTVLSVAAPGVLSNDSDVDGDPMTAVLVAGPTQGVLTLAPNGSFTYQFAADANGLVTFRYRASDGTLSSGAVTVSIDVTPVNDPPSAAPDSKASPHSTAVDIDVLANDTDPDGDALVISSVSQPSEGSVSVVGGKVRYMPPGDFVGVTTFSYTVSDGTLGDAAVVTVTVAAPVFVPPTPSPSPTPVPIPQPTTAPAAPSPDEQPTPTSEPVAPPVPSVSPAPSRSPSPSPSPRPTPTATPQPLPEVLAPLDVAQVTAAMPSGDAGGYGGFSGLFSGFSGGFAWAVPAAVLGLPGVLFMAAVGSQVVGAAAWVPAVRRSFAGAGAGARRRRRQPVHVD